jgi:putative FmdB family regulatory protein
MPIFDFVCSDCGHGFELFVRGSKVPACPECESTALEKQLSMPRVHSEGSKARSLASAKKRDARLGNERMHTRLEYETSHDD